MAKQKKPRRGPAPRKKPTQLEIAAHAIEAIAAREHTTPEMVRKHIQIAMLDGLVNGRMNDVPSEGEIPTPEELIAYGAEKVFEKRNE